ncbi:MAG: magnesium transporter [Sphingobacteriales bacterium]|jgi:magnesium transporter
MKNKEINKAIVKEVRKLISDNPAKLRSYLSKFHPSEVAVLLEKINNEDELMAIFGKLPIEMAPEVMAELNDEIHPERILELLHPTIVKRIIDELDADDAVDIIAKLDESTQEEILNRISEDSAINLRKLLAYKEDSAGGIMTTELVKVSINDSRAQAIKSVISQSEDVDNFFVVFAVDEHDRLVGTVTLQKLITAKSTDRISDLVEDELIYVEEDADQEEVVKIISQYNLPGLPVVDKAMVLVGRITFDDVMDIMEEESTEDLLKLSGVSIDEELRGTWQSAVKSRLPWLIVNLATASLASLVVLYFQDAIDKMVVLAVIMPIVAGLGGNAATQALAVTIRRLAVSDITTAQAYRTVSKEVLVGLINGMSIGTLISIIAFLSNQDPMLGVVVFTAMTGNLMIAGLTGSATPMILERLGVDPAVASSVFITAFTDVVGFILLFVSASILLL